MIKHFLDYKLIESEKLTVCFSDLIQFAFIIFCTWLLAKFIQRLFRNKVRKHGIDGSSAFAISRIVQYFIWIIGFMMALESLGIKMSIFLAGSAALLVGIGLGLQQIFKDLVSGIFILFESKLRIGDIVQVNSNIGTNTVFGTIRQIGVRTSEIETADSVSLIIPNSALIGNPIINWSTLYHQDRTESDQIPPCRASIAIGVDYTSDPRLVQKLLLDIAEKHPRVSSQKNPFVRFSNFGDSALSFELFFFVDSPLTLEDVKSDLRYAVFECLKKNKIEIPFPQRVVSLKK